MRAIAKAGAIGTLLAVVGFGLAACQTQQGTATRIATTKGDVGPATWLATPEGDGPFPAVVLLHGCTGTERNTSHKTVWRGLGRHAALLNRNGYVTLIVDSFGPRRIRRSCAGEYAHVQVNDAYGAFDHLASLPFVDAERIGVVGLSLGGSTALRVAANMQGQTRPTYAAAVAYYPYCHDDLDDFDIPTMILIGADDDWTPARLCRAVASRDTEHVELTIYPDTHHSFDLPMRGPYLVEGVAGRKHTVQGNDRARLDSQARMLKFFKEHLGGSYEEARGGESDIVAYLGLRALLSGTATALSTE